MTRDSSSSSLQNLRSWAPMFQEAKKPTQSSPERYVSKHPFRSADVSQSHLEPSKPHLFDYLEKLRGSVQEQAALSLRASAVMSSKSRNEEEEVDKRDQQNTDHRYSRPVSLLSRMRSFFVSMSQVPEQNENEVIQCTGHNQKFSLGIHQKPDEDRGARLTKRQRQPPINNLPESKYSCDTDSAMNYPKVLESNTYPGVSKGKMAGFETNQPVSTHTVSGMHSQSSFSSPAVAATKERKDDSCNYQPPQKRERRHSLTPASTALKNTGPGQMRQSWSWVASADKDAKPTDGCAVIGPSFEVKKHLTKDGQAPLSSGGETGSSVHNLKVASVFRMSQHNPWQDTDSNPASYGDKAPSSSDAGKLTAVASMRLAIHEKGSIPELSQGNVNTSVSIANQDPRRRSESGGKRKQSVRNTPKRLVQEVRGGSSQLVGAGMRHMVFDTSSLLESDPGVLNLIVEKCVICIPFTVLHELDLFNKGINKTMSSAETDSKREWLRHRSREIRNFILAQQRSKHPDTSEACHIRIQKRTEVMSEYHDKAKSNDDYILGFAVYLKEREKLDQVTFITEDKFLLIKAKNEIGDSYSYVDLKRSFGLHF